MRLNWNFKCGLAIRGKHPTYPHPLSYESHQPGQCHSLDGMERQNNQDPILALAIVLVVEVFQAQTNYFAFI